MYNRYIPAGGSYTRVVEEDAPPPVSPTPDSPPASKPSGLSGLLQGLHLEGLDTGDLLLLVLLLLLAVDGDDIELLITLGLLLLLGLDD